MPLQLDILAIEPFFGGARRAMLETLHRYSRHRWNVLKLPARRIERRLAASAHWFSEVIARSDDPDPDIVFSSETINLPEFFRLVPRLASKPCVVYFHDNQLPEPGAFSGGRLDLLNLSTATVASDAWFNSLSHLRIFLARASAALKRHPDQAARFSTSDFMAKARILPPPVDGAEVFQALQDSPRRERRSLIVDIHAGPSSLLSDSLSILQKRAGDFRITTVGVSDTLCDFPHLHVPQDNAPAIASALVRSSVYLGTEPVQFDHLLIQGLRGGCWPVLVNAGFYREVCPDESIGDCLFDPEPESLASSVMNAWHAGVCDATSNTFHDFIASHDPAKLVAAMDERLDVLASGAAGS